MIKKFILSLFFILYFINQICAKFEIYFIYKGNDYFVSPISNEAISIDPFDALKEIDQSQVHRLLLTSLEKSRLSSLFYVGEKFVYNNIELELINNDKFQIHDMIEGYKIIFSIGKKYDNIIIESSLNFGTKDFNITDKLATSFTVKYLLRRMINKITIKKDVKMDNMGQQDSKVSGEYNKFIDELKLYDPADAFNYITKYTELNFSITPKKNILEDWVNPVNLYFYKEGDYKSLAFFYYYSLKQAGFKVRSYLVTDLIRKNEEDIDYLKDLFNKKFKPSENLKRIQELELQYKHVNPNTNIKNFFDDYLYTKLKRPASIFFYYPPKFEESVFLITVELNDKWIYTVGNKWIDADIKNNPERTCAHYSRNGCYYTYIEKDFAILNNYPLDEKDIIWDLFYGIK